MVVWLPVCTTDKTILYPECFVHIFVQAHYLRAQSHYSENDDDGDVTFLRSHYDRVAVIVIVTFSCCKRQHENSCRDYDYYRVRNDDS